MSGILNFLVSLLIMAHPHMLPTHIDGGGGVNFIGVRNVIVGANNQQYVCWLGFDVYLSGLNSHGEPVEIVDNGCVVRSEWAHRYHNWHWI